MTILPESSFLYCSSIRSISVCIIFPVPFVLKPFIKISVVAPNNLSAVIPSFSNEHISRGIVIRDKISLSYTGIWYASAVRQDIEYPDHLSHY